MNSKKRLVLFSIQFIILFPIFSINIVWTGSASDNAFFNETNWKNTATNLAPAAGTIDPGVAINANITIENATEVVGGTSGISTDILMGTGNLIIRKSTLKMAVGKGIDLGNALNNLTIDSAVVTADFLKNATTTISGDSKLYLTAPNPFDVATNINITSYDAWIFAVNLNASTAVTSHVPRIRLNGNGLVDMSNARISQYYYGCAIAAYNSTIAPLRVFDTPNLSGNFADITIQTIKSGIEIPSNMNNKIVSFKLKKGYMATFALNDDGTGISQVYIASETDLYINALPNVLKNKISFIRVIPWTWANKKGTGGDTKGVNASWYYNWGSAQTSNLDRQYAPMTWGKSSIDTQSKVNALVQKTNVSHLMSFNESDNCEDQSGKYGMLCNVDTAVKYQRNLMKTGLRILSPSCREGEELRWVKNLNTLAVKAEVRMDAIGMHWYDWGANPSNTPDEDPSKIFARFKAKVISCYNYYKMPIWITEFNANKFRNTWVQDEFLKLALPWLESVWYVERYAYFQPFGGKGNFFDEKGNITSTGTIYLNQVSTPAIREQDYNKGDNNLQNIIDIDTDVKEVFYNKKTFVVYPNPANDELLVVSDENIDVTIINMEGSKIKSFFSNQKVAINDISKGVYIVSANGYMPQKILVF